MYKLKARQWNSCIQKLAHKIGMHYSPKNCIFCNFGPLVWVHDTNIFENIFVINKNFITTYLIKQLLDTIAYQNSKILFFFYSSLMIIVVTGAVLLLFAPPEW